MTIEALTSPGDIALVEYLYRECCRIRMVEEKVVELYPTDKIKSPVHLSIGQEAISVGVCAALSPGDVAFGTYRSHALYLAKGGDLRAMIAELYGKVTGCARGKAGSMHLGDVSAGIMNASAVVATGVPHAVGYALALRMRRSKAVVVAFFGDGAMDEGVFHESLNFAVLKRLPVLFVCENNDYAIYSALADRASERHLARRAAGYGLNSRRIEGGDIFAIRDGATRAVAAIRSGGGPEFLECMTFRWRDHVGPAEDRGFGYRSDDLLDDWIAEDQVRRLAELLPPQRRAEIDSAIRKEIEAAVEFAENSAFPDSAELYEHVFHG
jgi:pyruvate dehydrogenase E1 component alpha subunit